MGRRAGLVAWTGLAIAFWGCNPGVVDNSQDRPPSFEDGADGIYFERDIQPILTDYCVRCHGGVRELGGLNLQTRPRAAHVLGCRGCPAENSQLYARVSSPDAALRMPAGGQPLPADKIDILRRWLVAGAAWPTHWAYQPRSRQEPGDFAVSDESWVRSPIDRFILNRLDQAGVTPTPEADRNTLLRRAALDLTGLPPSPEEVDAFLADPSPSAFETVVDRLLASPAFGERWGRHWLDQARYADSDGYEKDQPRFNAWRYRDWVVDAVNSDMSFDEFTREQIAGDLLPNATPRTRLGTAFHTQTLLNTEGGVDPEEDRVRRVVDRTATVANVWLGLSAQCTQCHSHPYDALSQTEFYELYAFFDAAEEAQITIPAPDGGDAGTADVLQKRSGSVATYLLLRGNFLTPDLARGPLEPGTPSTLPPLGPRLGRRDRSDLANWLVDPQNPLTARVIVNTIWYHLFGRGIVTSLADFGTRGALPSHPELLDFLAEEFVRQGWSRKALIKEIMSSSTYRQSSNVRSELAEKDPEGALFARQQRVRLEAEIVVDSALSVSGLLSHKMGGPCVFPPLPAELRSLVTGPYSDFDWPDSSGEDRYRRGLYTFHKRSAAYPTLQVFDWPASDVSVNGRGHSNTPLQALTTLHEITFLDAARALARRVQRERPGELDAQLVYGFRLALARAPSADELGELESLFNEQRADYAAAAADAAALVGEFQPEGVPLADAAAWVATARVILNLDEFITRE